MVLLSLHSVSRARALRTRDVCGIYAVAAIVVYGNEPSAADMHLLLKALLIKCRGSHSSFIGELLERRPAVRETGTTGATTRTHLQSGTTSPTKLRYEFCTIATVVEQNMPKYGARARLTWKWLAGRLFIIRFNVKGTSACSCYVGLLSTPVCL